ncbi:MAG: hypothetical protein JXR73_05580 [Candidatus Omnitrophica bacterium]|nr:hypothetical protein [Candidatus Omnitrophota bacterium]
MAPLQGVEPKTFKVTHPFHPLYGRELDLVIRRKNWGEDRVYYHDETGNLISLPIQYTSVKEIDPFVVIAAGRSLFRFQDLVSLVRVIKEEKGKEAER